ncbi:MAG: ATP-binding domain-containing protein [Methanohalophilus sp. T328-1]|jgi:hypothetical protein|nr:MAG: ATP-binding domain-containing protein [Methanohalophilus sp. T328-1]
MKIKNDYSNIKKAKAEPDAGSMIETFRAIGYSIETAIADIIDNSITADSKNIWINYHWNGPDTYLSIFDDGYGMNNEELIQAMRPGSKNPLEPRDNDDLGRFGLGLKTASFSQTRKFSVFSKKTGGEVCLWSWDLDFVNISQSWDLVKYCPNENEFVNNLKQLKSGTCVVWWDLDRVTKDTLVDDESSKNKFLETMDNVKTHLSMVFHRFIEEGTNIFFQQRKIDPWDPFMIGSEGLQSKPEVKLQGTDATIKGFILPHRSKLSPLEYNSGKGPKKDWTAHQGFYVYRNKRLLVAGNWLGLFKKEVHYDLCRIRIELTNNVDEDWQIDIKKSIARPPVKYKNQIIAVAKESRKQALEVYRNKGTILKRKLSKDEYFPFWEERVRHGKRFYKINRKHPILKDLFANERGLNVNVEEILQFIEETVPVPLITLQENENELPHGQPFEGRGGEAVKNTMEAMYNSLINKGKDPEHAKSHILSIEPFNYYPEYLEYLGAE